ncbi:restriction endonuclease subunit S, partial [Agathobacter rectalis]
IRICRDDDMEQSVKDILADDFWIMPATPEYIDKGVPYITSKNIKNGTIDFSKVNYISQEDYEYISKNRPILVGDILISMIGTLGETAEVKETDGLFYGQNMFLVRIDESKVNKRYFLNFFKSNCVKRALKGKQNQSTQKYLKANHIEDLIIPVPDVTKQELIAKQLDKLTYIITLRTNELKQLDDLIKARFVEMFG